MPLDADGRSRRAADKVDADALLRLTEELIRIPSENPPGDVTLISERVYRDLESLHPDELRFIEPVPGRRSVVARFKGRTPSPSVTFYSHLDVVPVNAEERPKWDTDPLVPTLNDGKLYGRGATDTKGGISSSIAAMRAFKASGVEQEHDIYIMAVADGEVGDLAGIKYMAENGILPGDMAVACEPTYGRIVRCYKGRIWFELNIKGRAVHASVPEEGIPAILKAAQVILAMQQMKLVHEPHHLLGPSTLAWTTIKGGSAVNAMAGDCRITFDVRLVPGQTVDGVYAEIERFLATLREKDSDLHTELKILPGAGRESVETAENSDLVRELVATIPAVTDHAAEFGAGIESPGGVYHYLLTGRPGVFYGPGNIRLAHLPNEYLEVSKLVELARVYAGLMARLCGR